MVNKLSNSMGFYLHIFLSRSNPKSNPISIYVPAGPVFEGWFHFATYLESLLLFSASRGNPALRFPSSSNPTKSNLSYVQVLSKGVQNPKKIIFP